MRSLCLTLLQSILGLLSSEQTFSHCRKQHAGKARYVQPDFRGDCAGGQLIQQQDRLTKFGPLGEHHHFSLTHVMTRFQVF